MAGTSIKEEMSAIDRRDFSWWNKLTPEQQKAVSPWVLMRFTSSTKASKDVNEHYLTFTNEIVNVHFNKLKYDPQMQIMLMQLVGIGQNVFHPWVAPGKRGKQDPIANWLYSLYPEINEDELDILMQQYTKKELKQLAKDCGLTDGEIKKIFK